MTHTFFHDHVKLGDHDYHQLQFFNEKPQASSSTISSHFASYSVQDQGSSYPREAHQLIYQQEAKRVASEGGSQDDHGLKLCSWKNEDREGNQISGHSYENIPSKWLPSKLRLVRRMMGSDRTASEAPAKPQITLEDYREEGSSYPIEASQNSSSYYSSSIPIRVCSDCNTTKTPLWRSGPSGPKSLCNACGIRQRKARRALAAAAAAANDTNMVSKGSTPSIPKVQQKDKKSKTSTQLAPCKKRSKLGNKNERKDKHCFENLLIDLSKNLAFHKVFPQDEKEAAILLMALSSGLVHG